jgi:acyl-CoA dehydrogenase
MLQTPFDLSPLAITGIGILITLVLGFTGAPILLWTIGAAVILYLAQASMTPWIVFAVIAAVLNIKPIRAALISSVILKVMKALKFVPQISDTERAAIEAGDVWIEKELFSGKPDFKNVMDQPYAELTAEEKAYIAGPVQKLCDMLDDWKISQDRDLPNEVMEFIKKERFFGLIVPKEYGGLGLSAMCNSEVVKKISSRSLAAGITVMVPNSLGPAELLSHYGTQAQKDRWLKRLAYGEEIPCFALTEPGAGSDAGSIMSTGELFKGADGKLMVKLNWEKRWITLAAIATVQGLAVKIRDPQNLLGKGTELGITCLLVASNTPGITLGKRHDPLNTPFYNCPTRGKDVIVNAEEAIIGGLDGIGQGWKMLMACLGAGRGISLPAQSTGGAQLAAQISSAHATVRKQFGMSVGKFEGVEEPLARLAGSAYMLEASRRFTCGALDKGLKPAVITAIAKYNSTEIMRKSVNDAMDILGGSGISRGPKNVLASAYTAIPIGITVEGANILTRTLMIFGQGALRAHPYALEEVMAIEKNSLRDFDRAFMGHIGHVVRNSFRSVLLSLTRGFLASTPGGRMGKHYRRLSWASASFAICADIAMGTLGGSLKAKQMVTGRFADILSAMYLGSSVLRRWEYEGRKEEDVVYVNYCMEKLFADMQVAFDGLFANLTVPGATWFFRGVIGTWSRINRLSAGPSDYQTHKIAQAIQTPGAQRSRIIEGIYLANDGHVFELEKALVAVKASDAADKKVKAAVRSKKIAKVKGPALYESALKANVINQAEYDVIAEAEKLRWSAIQVDEFTLEDYAARK